MFDASGAAILGAVVEVHDESAGFAAAARSDSEGRYHVAAIPVGTYTVTATAAGFRPEAITGLSVDVGRTIVRDFHLAIGAQDERVVVRADAPLVDRVTTTLGHVITAPTVQQIPLNGRHFMDLGLLAPGSVSPSQTGFSSRPVRGLGSFSFNTAGNRDTAVGFIVNGVSANNLTFGELIFEPPLASLDEFKVDTSVFGPEQGHVSGAMVNIVTRSGTDQFHGEAFEFFRNDALDARNYFEVTPEPHPFNRNQFGGSVGGPISRGRTFFLVSYEGVRQRQGVDMNSLVLSDAQRALVTDPVVRQLIPFIPSANFVDVNGTPRFVGSAPAVVDRNGWATDVTHRFRGNDRIHAYFGRQRADLIEPAAQGNSIPGFGSVRQPLTGILTLNETHVFSPALLNEVRLGRTVLDTATLPASPLNPATLGINDGVTESIGLPQMVVAGDLNFGGPAIYPQGRRDTLYVVADTLSHTSSRHSAKLGGEYSHFVSDNFNIGTGRFNFASVESFLAGTANAFTTTLGTRSSVIDQQAVSFFFEDSVRVRDNLTLEFGLRYDWHVTPTERDDRFVVFDAASASLRRVGVDTDSPVYRQNNRNIEPRVGMAWSLSDDGRTVVRAAYGSGVDQPGTWMVRDTAGNPPFGVPRSASGTVPLASAIDATRPVALAPATVDPGLRNPSVRSWNVNLQRQLSGSMAVTMGYLGSRGRNLMITRNLNQPVDGVRPFQAVSLSSPISPGAPLGNIMQAESSGYSRYQAGFVSVSKRLSYGLQFDASYTLSQSLDTNSVNSTSFNVQNAYDIPAQYGRSDFDARHRFVLSAIYALPFARNALVRGWQVALVTQAQTGNPVNIVTSNSSLTGVPNTVRPDLTGPITIIGSVNQWFDPSVFVAVNGFGNLPRNAVTGPGFRDTDVSLMKNVPVWAGATLQLHVDAFNVFNHPNFGQPGTIVGTPTFGQITSTRLPTGEAGSSRQIQLAARLSF